MKLTVTMIRTDGHVFNNGYETIAEVRAALARYAAVLQAGETLTFSTEDEPIIIDDDVNNVSHPCHY